MNPLRNIVNALRASPALVATAELRQVAEERRPVASLVLPLAAAPIDIETEADELGLARLLAHTERTWTRLGDEEPHWSVISAERFRQDQVDGHRAEFYASGQGDVNTFLAFLARNRVDAHHITRVLEFGCGLGRITRYLAETFEQVVGMDISPSHLRQADTYLRANGLAKVELQRVQSLADIDGPADMDAIFSVIVLQHNPPPAIVSILERLLRRLRPGGVAYFQVPTHACDYRFKLEDHLSHGLTATHIEMHCLPQRRIFQIARDAQCDVLEVREDDWVGRRDVELSNTFLLQRR